MHHQHLLGPILTLACFFGHIAEAGDAAGTSPSLPRSTPEQQGISSSAILDFVSSADQDIDTMHSFMLVRHGRVVTECWWKPYDAQTPHIFYSLSKSFTSTAVGIAIGEGKMSLDDEVLKAFPEDAPPEPSANLRALRVRDLLRMAAGHQNEVPIWKDDPGAPAETWTHRFFAQPIAFKPGTRFLYDSPATYMLSAMVQKATGSSVLEYLRPRLFDPIGFENPTWVASPQGISAGAFGLMGRTEDIARFGQVYLQKGVWQGKQLVPAAWVEEATSLQTGNGSNPKSDWDQGYGFQFWRCRHHAFRGDGAFGQYCVVIPESDAVIAITSGVHDMQAVLNLVWDKLLPAMHQQALADDESSRMALEQKLISLMVRIPAGQPTSPQAAAVSGIWFTVPENDRSIATLAFDFKSTPPALLVRTAAGEVRTPIGIGSWSAPGPGFANGLDRFLAVPAHPFVSASGAWTADDVFTVKITLCQTPFSSTMTFHFDGRKLIVDAQHNVAFGPTKLAQLIGEASASR